MLMSFSSPLGLIRSLEACFLPTWAIIKNNSDLSSRDGVSRGMTMPDVKEPIIIKPSKKLLQKWYLQSLFPWLMIILFIDVAAFLPLMLLPFLSETDGMTTFLDGLIFLLFINAFILVIMGIIAVMLFPFLKKYFNTFEYRITSDIIEVRKGLINKTKKFVPYRTITNINTVHGFFDRMFKIGSVHVETAGTSGTILPEERLMGLTNPEEIQEIILTKLKAFRTPHATTTEAIEPPPVPSSESPLIELLNAVKEIKEEVIKIREKLET